MRSIKLLTSRAYVPASRSNRQLDCTRLRQTIDVELQNRRVESRSPGLSGLEAIKSEIADGRCRLPTIGPSTNRFMVTFIIFGAERVLTTMAAIKPTTEKAAATSRLPTSGP